MVRFLHLSDDVPVTDNSGLFFRMGENVCKNLKNFTFTMFHKRKPLQCYQSVAEIRSVAMLSLEELASVFSSLTLHNYRYLRINRYVPFKYRELTRSTLIGEGGGGHR